jgi:aspartate/methionine/tyrosine aminotransferase
LQNTKELQEKRDTIAAALKAAGLDVLASEGTYFITASIRNLTNEPDREFCMRLTREAGVGPIPISAFYSAGGPTDLVRFAFCKKHTVLEEAGRRLVGYFSSSQGRESRRGN